MIRQEQFDVFNKVVATKVGKDGEIYLLFESGAAFKCYMNKAEVTWYDDFQMDLSNRLHNFGRHVSGSIMLQVMDIAYHEFGVKDPRPSQPAVKQIEHTPSIEHRSEDPESGDGL